ncbi:hypothetical protein E4U55_004335, partial [Claviceps digitariae]
FDASEAIVLCANGLVENLHVGDTAFDAELSHMGQELKVAAAFVEETWSSDYLLVVATITLIGVLLVGSGSLSMYRDMAAHESEGGGNYLTTARGAQDGGMASAARGAPDDGRLDIRRRRGSFYIVKPSGAIP